MTRPHPTLVAYDQATKLAFSASDLARWARRWRRQLVDEVRAAYVRDPAMVQQLALIGLAAVIEVLASYARRKD